MTSRIIVITNFRELKIWASKSLLKIFNESFETIKNSEVLQCPATHCLFLLESVQTALNFYQYEVAIACVDLAEKILGKTFSLSGALGKKTKFQQESIAQLYVKVESNSEKTDLGDFDSVESDQKGLSDILLDDDQLLNTTKFQDAVINEQHLNMTPFGIATLLTKLGLRMKTGPAKDRINEEEQLAMIDFILQNPKVAPTSATFEALRIVFWIRNYRNCVGGLKF